MWTLENSGSDARVGDSATTFELSTPVLSYSMDINALNYCRFSLMSLPSREPEEIGARALIATPNLIESHLVSSILHFKGEYSLIFDRQTSGKYLLATGFTQPSVKPACLNLRMAAGSILLELSCLCTYSRLNTRIHLINPNYGYSVAMRMVV